MSPPDIPPYEEARLAALNRLLLACPGSHQCFELIVNYAATEFESPMCAIAFVDLSRQWFKARIGISASTILRSISFCGHTILQEEVFVINDTLADFRFYDNPLVTEKPYVRFYAGAALIIDGYSIGTLCIMDIRPRNFSHDDRILLSKLRDFGVSKINELLNN